MVKGYLSQLVNVINECQIQLSKGETLPVESEKIKQQALLIIDESVSSIQNVQKLLQKQAISIHNDLLQALSMVYTDKEKCLLLLSRVDKMALEANHGLNEELKKNYIIQEQFFSYSQELYKHFRALEIEDAKIRVEAQKAKDKAKKYEKERYYFLALGPFGLAGLATATGLFTSWSTKASNASKKASKSKAQLEGLQASRDQIKMTQDSFGLCIGALSGVKNTLAFLSSGLHNIMQNNENKNETLTLLTLYLNASISEVTILMQDIA
ncbi:hypothetical protein ATO12_15720 [Aquimarina atlantica]|uniref:Uncharacterized protein n=1 Tax=Aquimarina atlantica TaxID=1317122 RepID=A0A023BTP6_9FLAO|nr:hypothetical protein [Aquimarina atlantica]EZH73387.1 hypothetical protein ATO12_15720 [Aquimarina atlantica]